MIPELRQLRYFVAVAEELHFSRAARRLNIAQPPLSQQITQLERGLGVQLFIRTTRRVELTPAGAVFLEGARRTLAEATRTTELVRRAGRGEFETLRVGFSDAAALSVLPDAVRRFRAAFPSVHLELREDAGASQGLDAVRSDLVDVALVRGPLAESALQVDIVLEEPFSVALWEAHPLARRRRVPLPHLAGTPFILFPRRLSPTYYDLLMGMLRGAGFAPNVAYEVERHQTALSLVAAEVGVSLVPNSIRNLGRAGVVFRELAGTHARAQVAAAYRPNRPSLALDGWLAVLHDVPRRAASTAPHRRPRA